MNLSQTNTTNPHQIQRIARHQIDLVVNRDAAGHATSFVVNSLALEDLSLPDQGRIKLIVYSSANEQSIDLGMVAAPALGTRQAFSVNTNRPFQFRLIVTEVAGPKIIASCEGFRATEDSEESGRDHLLPVEPSDNLQQKLWELRIEGDGEPVLYVNNDEEVGMLARIRGDALVQALVLPQAFEQVLLALVDHLDDEEGWYGKWNAYLAARGIEGPDHPDDPDNRLNWARSQAQKFANEHNFLNHARSRIQEGSYDG